MKRAFALALLIALAAIACSKAGPPAAPTLVPTLTPTPPSPSPSPSPLNLETSQEIGLTIAHLETEIRAETTQEEAYDSLGRLQQRSYRLLVDRGDLRESALANLTPEIRTVALAHIGAGEKLRSLTKPITKIPDWKIIAPPPAEELKGHYMAASAEFGVPWEYLASIHLVETRMGRIRGTSSAGAQGPMQFIPSTWARYGEGDINNPRDAIFAAARYLKAAGAPGNMPKALFAYNHSTKYVDAVTVYAEQIAKNPRTYLAYHNWQVYVRTTSGDVLLEVGYGA